MRGVLVRPDLDDLQWERRRWDGWGPYSESKLWDVVLAFALARLWLGVRANAVDPGWVPTRMGGRGAPDDLELGGAPRWPITTARRSRSPASSSSSTASRPVPYRQQHGGPFVASLSVIDLLDNVGTAVLRHVLRP